MAARSTPEQNKPGTDSSGGQGRPPRSAQSDGTAPGSPPLYKGEPLDAERGPGLGCFWSQVVVLAILVVLTPIAVVNAWPVWLTTVMLFATLGLLLLAGQTVIFLLRLVAADRRTRRRPLRSATPTIGELEDTTAAPDGTCGDIHNTTPAPDAVLDATAAPDAARGDTESEPPGVRQ